MKISNIKIWLKAVRPFSFTGSLIPVILGAVMSIGQNRFSTVYLVLSLFGIVLLHASVNLMSDSDDYVNNVDTPESSGSSGVIINKQLSAEAVKKAGKLLLTAGFILGVYMALNRGWVVILLGLIGALGGYSYTGKPLSLKYRGLGAPLVFTLFGPLIVMGSFYIQAQKITLAAILVSIPVGLLTTAILHANDVRDIVHDKKANIKTLSIMIGKDNAKKLYYMLIICSYAAVLIMAFYKLIPYWSLACLITLPAALKCISKLHRSKDNDSNIVVLDKITAKLHAQFGSILAVSILLPSIIR